MYTSDLAKFGIDLHTIILIFGEIWSEGSILLVNVFAEVAQVNTEVLNIKSYQPWQNIAEEVPRQNVCSYS